MSDKNIFVNFVHYEPYEPYPDTIAYLGDITNSECMQLMDTFTTQSVLPNACIRHMSLEFIDKTYFGRAPWHQDRRRTLNLSSMFYNNMPKCGQQNCELDDTAKIKRCIRNLRAGKCQDEFIRNTLGAILFPYYYGKQK